MGIALAVKNLPRYPMRSVYTRMHVPSSVHSGALGGPVGTSVDAERFLLCALPSADFHSAGL